MRPQDSVLVVDATNGEAGWKNLEPAAAAPRAPEPTWLRDYTLTQSELVAMIVAQTPIVLLFLG